MAHLLDRLLMRPYVKDEGLARYIDDVMAKLQLVFRVELSSYAHHAPYTPRSRSVVIGRLTCSIISSAVLSFFARMFLFYV